MKDQLNTLNTYFWNVGMGSTTMRSWHGKASRMLLHGSANRRSPHPFGSFSIVLKRKRILPLTITEIHLNGKRITRHEAAFSASWRAFLGCSNLLILKYLCNPGHSHGKLLDRRFVPLVVPMQNAVEDDSIPGNDTKLRLFILGFNSGVHLLQDLHSHTSFDEQGNPFVPLVSPEAVRDVLNRD